MHWFLFSSVCTRRLLSIFAFHFDFARLNLKMCHRFSDNCCFNAFICRANFRSSFINFISYCLLFWHDKFSMLLCEKDNKVTWVQSHVALPLVINFLKSSFRNDFSSNFNLSNFVSWFSDSRAFEKCFFIEFCFCCCYSVPIVFNFFFLFSVCWI